MLWSTGIANSPSSRLGVAIVAPLSRAPSKLMKSGVVTPEVYREHMTSFFGSVRADRDALLRAIELPGYEKEFRDECRKYASYDVSTREL